MENGAFGVTGLTLEDVSSKPEAPKPEPKPYYYSIRSSGDPLSAPQFDLIRTGCKESNTHEPIGVNYLDVGFPSPFNSETPPEEIQKSDNIRLLAGQLNTPEGGYPASEDTWSFTGSG